MLYNGHINMCKSIKEVPKVILHIGRMMNAKKKGESIMISLYRLLADYIMRYLNLDVMCI